MKLKMDKKTKCNILYISTTVFTLFFLIAVTLAGINYSISGSYEDKGLLGGLMFLLWPVLALLMVCFTYEVDTSEGEVGG